MKRVKKDVKAESIIFWKFWWPGNFVYILKIQDKVRWSLHLILLHEFFQSFRMYVHEISLNFEETKFWKKCVLQTSLQTFILE